MGWVSVASIYVLRTPTKQGRKRSMIRRACGATRRPTARPRPAGGVRVAVGGARWRPSIPASARVRRRPHAHRVDPAGGLRRRAAGAAGDVGAQPRLRCRSWSRRCATPRGCGETSPRPKRPGSGRRSRQRRQQPVRLAQRDADRVVARPRRLAGARARLDLVRAGGRRARGQRPAADEIRAAGGVREQPARAAAVDEVPLAPLDQPVDDRPQLERRASVSRNSSRPGP